MSKKLWFIFEDGHHTGPFETAVMLEKIARGELLETGQVWTEGLAHWVAAHEIEVFESAFEPTPPPLPPLPVEPEDFEEFEAPDDLPPPLPPLPIAEEPPELPPLPVEEPVVVELSVEQPEVEDEVAEEKEDEDTDILQDFEKELEGEEQLFQRYRFWALGVGLVVILLSLWFFGPTQLRGPTAPSFHELRSADGEVFRAFIRADKDRDRPFILALTRDTRSVVMASPLRGEFQVYLILSSLPQEILSEEPVVLESRAIFKGYQAHFRELELIQGRGFVPGKYRFEVVAVETGYGARWSQWRRGEKRKIEFTGEQYFVRGTVEEFHQDLETYHSRMMKEELAHFSQRLEGYQTLGSLLNRIMEIYEETLGEIRNPELIDRFELRYAQEVGPLLQGLILEGIEQMTKLKENGDETEARSYELYVDFGRSIGTMVSDMVTTTRRSRQFNRAARERLQRLFSSRHQTLSEDLKVRLTQLEAALERDRAVRLQARQGLVPVDSGPSQSDEQAVEDTP